MDASVTPTEHSGVLHVFNRMEIGGAELRSVEVVSKVGLRFDFASVSGQRGRLDEKLRSEGHNVHVLRLSMRTIFQYFQLMRAGRYRVVHSNIGLASGPIVLLAWLAGCPKRIAHFQSDAVGGGKSLKKSCFLLASRLLIILFATDIIGVSPGSLTLGWRRAWHRDRRCQVVPNGFDTSVLRKLAEIGKSERAETAEFVVVNVGRPDPVKNRGRALRIWTALQERTSSSLLLVGALNAADLAAAQDKSTRAGARIEMTGDTDRVAFYLGAADVLLMTSTREGLPGVVLEALAVGLPVVATTLPGTEWIRSQLEGIELCSLEEPDDQWIAALVRAATFDRRDIMARFDRSEFTMQHAVDAFTRLWGLTK